MNAVSQLGTLSARGTAAVLIVLLSLAIPAHADGLDQVRNFNIEEQALDTALIEFSEQAGVQLMVPTELVADLRSPSIAGQYAVDKALVVLLDGSELTFQAIGDDTVTLQAADQRGASDLKNLNPQPMLKAQNQRAPTSTTSSQSSESGISIVTGKVTDARTGANLKGARITIEETGQWTSTNDLGEYRFVNVLAGSATLTVSYLGYAGRSAVVGVRGAVVTQNFALRGGSEIEELVVFGQRSARALALNQERTADNSVTVLSSDALGNFSGTTISEVLRRAPGISFQQDFSTGDGTNVIVRGLEPDLNLVKFNGLVLPDGSGIGRSADLSNLLADSVEKISIHKSLLPSHDSAGTGGLIEIETKSPLDRPARHASFIVEKGWRSNDFSDDLLLSGTLSRVFGDTQSFGISTSVQYRERELKTLSYDTELQFGQFLPLEQDGSTSILSIADVDPRSSFPFEAGASNAYPNNVGTASRYADTQNLSATVSAGWSIRNHTELSIDYQHSLAKRDDFSLSHLSSVFSGYAEVPVAGLGNESRQALVWDGFVVPGISALIAGQQYTVSLDAENETNTTSLRGLTSVGRWEFDYTLGYAEASNSRPNLVDFSFSRPVFPFAFIDPAFVSEEAIDATEGRILSPYAPRTDGSYPLPLLTQAGWDLFNNPDSYLLGSPFLSGIRGSNRRITSEFSSKINFDRSNIEYLQFGIRFEGSKFKSLNEVATSADLVNVPTAPSAVGLSFDSPLLADIDIGQGFSTIRRSDVESFARNIRSFAGGDNPAFILNSFTQDPRLRDVFTTEDELAGFVQGKLQFGKLEIVGGVRLSRVEVRSVNLTSPQFVDANGQRDTAFEAEFATLLDERARETEVLPRILFNYLASENLIVRGGYFSSVARPNISQLSRQQFLSLNLQPQFGPNLNQPTLSIIEGNPDLEPAKTDNFDLGVELYDDRVGVTRLSAFYKRIRNLLQSNDSQGVDVLQGVTLPDHPNFQNLPSNLFITGSRPRNSDRDATIWGFEAAVDRQFTELPNAWAGLGIYVNYTFTESEKDIQYNWFGSPVFDVNGDFAGRELEVVDFLAEPFDEQPKHSGTAAITYNYNNIDASLAYSGQSRRRQMFSPNNLHRYYESVDSLDLRIEYFLQRGTADYRVYFEASDLLRSASDPTLEFSAGGVGSAPKFLTGGNFLGGRYFNFGIGVVF